MMADNRPAIDEDAPLPPGQKLGWDPTLEEQHARELASITFAPCESSESEIPRQLDLTRVLPRRLQGDVGQCAGFSVAKALAGCAWADSQQVIDVSGSFSYAAGKMVDRTDRYRDSGASIGGAAVGANRYGVATVQEFPCWQTQGDFLQRWPDDNVLAGAANRKIRSVCPLEDSRAVARFLGTKQGFCLAGVWWVSELANYRGQAAIRPITQPPQGRNYGGHAMALMGYRFDADDLYLQWWNHHPQWGINGDNIMLVHERVCDVWFREDFGPPRGVSGTTGFRKSRWDALGDMG
jgi:hypothetical protein